MSKLIKIAEGILTRTVNQAIHRQNPSTHTNNTIGVGSKSRIMLIGDSLAQGLESILKSQAQQSGTPFIAKGIQSTTVKDWVNNGWLDSTLSEFKPTHVLISLGTNDAFSMIPVEDFKNKMVHLLNKIKSAGAIPIWIGNPSLPEKGLAGTPLRKDILQTIVNTAPAFLKSDTLSLNQVDSIHPSSGGYSSWAGAIWGALGVGSAGTTVEEQKPVSEAAPATNAPATKVERKHEKYEKIRVDGVDNTCGIMVPSNPIKPDGSVDFIFAIKMFGSGNTQVASNLGTDAVVISLFVTEMGDVKHKEFVANFKSPNGSGPAEFINYIRNEVLKQLQEQNPDKPLKLGKLVLTWWSGGFSAGAAIINDRSKIIGGIDSVVALDGMYGKNPEYMKAYTDFAKEAMEDPNKKFFVAFSRVEAPYKNTQANADTLLQNTGLQFRNVKSFKGQDVRFGGKDVKITPARIAAQGGFAVMDLYGDNPSIKQTDQHTLANLWGQQNLIYRALE